MQNTPTRTQSVHVSCMSGDQHVNWRKYLWPCFDRYSDRLIEQIYPEQRECISASRTKKRKKGNNENRYNYYFWLSTLYLKKMLMGQKIRHMQQCKKIIWLNPVTYSLNTAGLVSFKRLSFSEIYILLEQHCSWSLILYIRWSLIYYIRLHEQCCWVMSVKMKYILRISWSLAADRCDTLMLYLLYIMVWSTGHDRKLG